MAQPSANNPERHDDWQESKRMSERVRGYWNSLRENRPYPHEDEVDPAAIADVWDFCFLVDMRKGNTQGFRYDYMGRELIEAYGTNLTGVEHCDITLVPHVAMMLREFEAVVESGEPASHEDQFENVNHERIKYRCCLLPLGTDKVDYILGCMRWKPY